MIALAGVGRLFADLRSTFGGPRLWAPEVVQTSSMDCGPASLKSLLQGFGVDVSYGRLREACQTDVDGTSIDTMEVIANQLGLDAEQVMMPIDHFLLPESGGLPAIVVVHLPSGDTHFVVVWNKVGGLVQVMDPGTGRRWVPIARLLEEVYEHVMPVPASAFREYAGEGGFLDPLRVRLASIGASSVAEPLIARSLADPSVRTIATVDAATRMATALVEADAVPRSAAASFVAGLVDRALQGPAPSLEEDPNELIPASYWTVRPSEPDPESGEARVALKGAVLVRVKGVRASDQRASVAELSPELVAALAEKPASPLRDLLRMLREDGLLGPAVIATATVIAVFSALVEALLFRGLFDVSRSLGLFSQRLGAGALLLVFLVATLLLELPITSAMQRLGRHLEARLRVAFLRKIPRLGDRYFQSRPTSDMAARSHSVHMLRILPGQGGALVHAVLDLFVTTAGIAWIDPKSAPLAIVVAVLAVVIPIVLGPVLSERDMKVRAHGGSLSRFYLDAFLGLSAVRTHGAERSLRREHESLLAEWVRSSFALQRGAIAMEGLHAIIGFLLAGVLLVSYLARASEPARVMLLLYWALNLPALGESIAATARRYPGYRNITLRLFEPLGAIEESAIDAPSAVDPPGPASIALRGVSVVASGHTILDGLDLDIAPGEHVAIVGPSGAGKSSFAGLLLGWHRPSSGSLWVDGFPLDGARLATLRRATAWVDPAVQLWNRSLLENLAYGRPDDALPMSRVLDQADLRVVLEKMPEGLQTRLGEGGALVSGGEGQRVRLGRAMAKQDARLVILDEPFRGLDRDKRRQLLARSRELWARSTMLCITHDVGETQAFGRVLVVENGRVVEDGSPTELLEREGSRYRDLVRAEEELRAGVWSGAQWRKLRVARGGVEEVGS